MADFRFDRFSADFSARLEALGYSLGQAAVKWPLTDKAMLWRGANGKTLTAGNVLLLCQMAGLDPFAYLAAEPRRQVTRKRVLKQAVTRGVNRETAARETKESV